MQQQQDVRYRRIGGDHPYRDDPNAPVQLESFAPLSTGGSPGGVGIPFQTPSPDDWKKQQQQQWTSSNILSYLTSGGLCYCCCPTTTSNGGRTTTYDDEGPNGRYYRDDFNDYSWHCSVGTTDDDGIWLNQSDPAGTIMAIMVWILLGYSGLTVTLLAQTGGIHPYHSYLYNTLVCMALASHAKTMFTDPGSVPPSAVPTEEQRKSQQQQRLSMCSQCQTFKPPLSHHCRICNRCISKMDHHCPWMNNCVGAGNIKFFFLFLLYTWSCSVYCILLLGWNYFFCASEDCEFNVVLTQLVRIMSILCVGAFLFTSSMIMNVIYGILTGIGTIDRLKKKATNTMGESVEEPVPLTHIFGIGPWYTWPLPVDPLFPDFDEVMGYSTPQRLLREQILRENYQSAGDDSLSVIGNMSIGGGVPMMMGKTPPV